MLPEAGYDGGSGEGLSTRDSHTRRVESSVLLCMRSHDREREREQERGREWEDRARRRGRRGEPLRDTTRYHVVDSCLGVSLVPHFPILKFLSFSSLYR